jgi:hypothetical protein
VLLVDDGQPQAGDLHLAVDEGVGADDDVHLAGGQGRGQLPALGGAGAVGEQLDPDGAVAGERARLGDAEPVQEPAQREVVLLGQHLGGGHDRPLVAALHGAEQGVERHHRLARSHVPLQQPVHGPGGSQVGVDLGHGPGLVASELEGQTGPERLDEGAGGIVGDAHLLRLERPLAGHQAHLHAEELVEDEPAPGHGHVRCRLRPVDTPVGGGAVHQAEVAPQVERQGVGELAAALQGLGHQLAHLPGGDVRLPRLGVHGHDHAGLVVARLAQHVEGGVGHLETALVAVQLPEERHLGAGGELLGPPRLVEERQVEVRRPVGHHHLHQRLAPASAGHPGAHLAHHGLDCCLLADAQVGDVGALGPVEVAPGVVLEEVEDGADAHALQPGLQLPHAAQLAHPVVLQLAQRAGHQDLRSASGAGTGRLGLGPPAHTTGTAAPPAVTIADAGE